MLNVGYSRCGLKIDLSILTLSDKIWHNKIPMCKIWQEAAPLLAVFKGFEHTHGSGFGVVALENSVYIPVIFNMSVTCHYRGKSLPKSPCC